MAVLKRMLPSRRPTAPNFVPSFALNTLPQAGLIEQMGATAGPSKPDLKILMIAGTSARCSGPATAGGVSKLPDAGAAQGEHDLTMLEATSVIGKVLVRRTVFLCRDCNKNLEYTFTCQPKQQIKVDQLQWLQIDWDILEAQWTCECKKGSSLYSFED